jgi:hypothetical protein
MEQTKTAMRIANPSIQAVDRWLSSAVAVSIIMLTNAARIKIFMVKSFNAFNNNDQND